MEDLTVTHLTRAVGVVVPFHGVGTVIVDTPIITGTVITETRNVAGVEGLIQTTISGGLGRPIVNLSVPAYLLEAYGGNITAIQRDLEAGHLKDRGPCPTR